LAVPYDVGPGQFNSISGHIAILLGNGDGTSKPPADIALPTSPQVVFGDGGILAKDFDGDGKVDLALASYEARGLFL
jgi:hypothetical protein